MRLPVLYPLELIRIVQKLGFEEVRQKGSHKTFMHADGRVLTIAVHVSRPIPPGLLNRIIKQELKIAREEFLKYA
ncbi:MAG: type II toxin-antitoxin system HicA family toxin [Candidatus Diapherotrites archaeon]|nr:type II toxin-antitoxin system HicA family toxin [Candidatus Diapherotrites archaeon]